jgi:large subunit ribosomal protein L29
MKAKELIALSQNELQNELQKLLQQGFNLRMMKGSRQEIKPHLIKQVRRSIARIKTVMTKKELGAGE